MFELYLDDRRAKAGDYLMRYETKEIAYHLLKPVGGESGTAIKNKLRFPDYCRAHDLPAVPILAGGSSAVSAGVSTASAIWATCATSATSATSAAAAGAGSNSSSSSAGEPVASIPCPN